MFLVRPTNRVFECFWVSFCILDGKIVFQCFWSDPKTLRVFECFSEVLYCFCHLGSGGIPFVVHESRKRRDEFFSDPAPPPRHFGPFFFQKFRSETAVFNGKFSFSSPGKQKKPILLEGGYNFKTGQPMSILGHVQACPDRYLAQKTSVILKKSWAQK